MRKGRITVALAVILGSSIMLSSCVGSFGLFNRISKWNQGVSNKFVNELVFLALNIVPVYGVCYVADVLVLNSIEFWTGSNPMASVGSVKHIKGENGNYMVKTLKDGYSITKEGETVALNLIYDQSTHTWNAESNGITNHLLQMNNDGTAQLYLPDGTTMKVTLDAQGKMLAAQVTMSAFAAK